MTPYCFIFFWPENTTGVWQIPTFLLDQHPLDHICSDKFVVLSWLSRPWAWLSGHCTVLQTPTASHCLLQICCKCCWSPPPSHRDLSQSHLNTQIYSQYKLSYINKIYHAIQFCLFNKYSAIHGFHSLRNPAAKYLSFSFSLFSLL